jgi:hypothetical protein
MFCTHCGASVQPSQRFCGSCGTSIAAPGPAVSGPAPVPGAPVTPAAQSGLGRVGQHARMLGVLWIALSAIHLLRGGGRLLGARIVGIVGRGWSDEVPWGWPVGHIVPAFLSFMGLISLVLAAAGFIAGWGLLSGGRGRGRLPLLLRLSRYGIRFSGRCLAFTHSGCCCPRMPSRSGGERLARCSSDVISWQYWLVARR